MHHLHLRYVTEGSYGQSLRRFIQLLDDLPEDLRAALLRNQITSFEAYADIKDVKERRAVEYARLKERWLALCGRGRVSHIVVFGVIGSILAWSYSQFTVTLPRFIEDRWRDSEFDPESANKALRHLFGEQDTVRRAYWAFCDMVVKPLLMPDVSMDFGSEWLVDDSDPVPEAEIKERLAAARANSPGNDGPPVIDASDPIVNQFMVHLSGLFDVSLPTDSGGIYVRVGDTAAAVSVSVYSEPTEKSADRPLVYRLFVRGVSPPDRALRELGLPMNRKYFLSCNLEFSVLPDQLPLLADWTEDWIRGQVAKTPVPPKLPIEVDGGGEAFELSGGTDWLEVTYLWSLSAKQAYQTWDARTHRESSGEDN